MRSLLLLAALLLNFQPSEAATKAVSGFKVHEWGTFTSVQGSDGVPLIGLHHEEEALPSFVHNLDFSLESLRSIFPASVGIRCPVGCKHCCKGMCCDNLSTDAGGTIEVTQKMETPVLYFYTNSRNSMNVDISVYFPKGLISQYYPAPTSVQPLPSNITSLREGLINYSKLEILEANQKESVPVVSAGNVYAPARETASNLVRIGGETEKFIFYRGLGNFMTSLRVTSTRDKVTLKDDFGRGIPYILAVNIRNGYAAFRELGSLPAYGSKNFLASEFSQSLNAIVPVGAITVTCEFR